MSPKVNAWVKNLIFCGGSLSFYSANAITVRQLATVFKHVHDLSFRWKHCNSDIKPTFENFEQRCWLAVYKNPDLFRAHFGFTHNAEQRQLFYELFKRLKDLLLLPDVEIPGIPLMPIIPPFMLALDVATEMLKDFSFDPTQKAEVGVFDLFAARIKARVAAENAAALQQRSYARESLSADPCLVVEVPVLEEAPAETTIEQAPAAVEDSGPQIKEQETPTASWEE